MSKIGRNELCPWGSGKKYKRCCMAQDQESERQAMAAAAINQTRDDHDRVYDDELTLVSNSVVDLIRAGRLDEAQKAANALIEDFPEVHDGYDRLGMVHEKRGDTQQAIACYRKVIDFARAHPDAYEPAFEAEYQKIIDSLQPPSPPD